MLLLEPQLFFDSFFVSKGDSLNCMFVDTWSGREINKYAFMVETGTAQEIVRCLQVNAINVY